MDDEKTESNKTDEKNDATKSLSRRNFLIGSGVGLTGAAAGLAIGKRGTDAVCEEDLTGVAFVDPEFDSTDWTALKQDFEFDPNIIHLGGFLIASHSKSLRAKINEHRAGFDANPALYIDELRRPMRKSRADALNAIGKYLNVNAYQQVALTDSTTMGLGLIFNGLKLEDHHEIVITERGYFSSMESIKYRHERNGTKYRVIPLYDDILTVTEDELVSAVIDGIGPQTRVLALTWVHSDTGLKMPVKKITDEIRVMNAARDVNDRVLVVLDGVHAFGVEDFEFDDLGVDFFIAGCHKWTFGPRGTGIVCAKMSAWEHVVPIIPPFVRDHTPGGRNSPGGYHSEEHRWALGEGFKIHAKIGKANVTRRIQQLATRMKEGLSRIEGVQVLTPMDPNLSAGINCFVVEGYGSGDIVEHLLGYNIVGAVGHQEPVARVAPGLLNNEREVDRTIEVMAMLG